MDPCKWCLRVLKEEGYTRVSREGLSLTLVPSLIFLPLLSMGEIVPFRLQFDKDSE